MSADLSFRGRNKSATDCPFTNTSINAGSTTSGPRVGGSVARGVVAKPNFNHRYACRKPWPPHSKTVAEVWAEEAAARLDLDEWGRERQFRRAGAR